MRTALKFLFLIIFLLIKLPSFAQNNPYVALANKFISTLSADQKEKALYTFESDERYNWHFVPKEDRKGVYLKNLNASQKEAGFSLLKAYLSEKTFNQTKEIMELESVLRELENRKEGDWMRDPTRYAFVFFGEPLNKGAWGWRFEGHHLSFSFSTLTNKITSGTPSFMGSNPAIVLSGPHKGKQLLKNEAEFGFKMVQSLTSNQLNKATIAGETPKDIVTFVTKVAKIENPEGILFSELDKEQQNIFLGLLNVYVNRYTKKYAKDMMGEIRKADINKLRFGWAGATQPEIGKAHYYRIHGPTIIIEYDNSQNNANHAHTVIRDLKHDFGGDKLKEHLKKGHHHD